MGDDLQQPVRVSLVLFLVHRRALWELRASAGMVSASNVLRSLIRRASTDTVRAMQQHFAQTEEVPGMFGRLARPSLLLDAADLAQLDELAETTKAPSRSAATRFLILSASPTSTSEGAAR